MDTESLSLQSHSSDDLMPISGFGLGFALVPHYELSRFGNMAPPSKPVDEHSLIADREVANSQSFGAWNIPSDLSSGSEHGHQQRWDDVHTSFNLETSQLPNDAASSPKSRDRMALWYAANDGPWVSRSVIPNIAEDGASCGQQTCVRAGLTSAHCHGLVHTSEAGSVSAIAHEDSAYGSFDGSKNMSGDMSEVSTDSVGHTGEPHVGIVHGQDWEHLRSLTDNCNATDHPDPVAGCPGTAKSLAASTRRSGSFICPVLTCRKSAKTRSEMKYNIELGREKRWNAKRTQEA